MDDELIEALGGEEIEIPAVEDDPEVEIIDDTPTEQKQPARKADAENVEEDSARVQKRIKKLNYEKNEALRQLGIREREHAVALKLAKDSHSRAKWEEGERIKAQGAWKAEAAARREAELRFNKGEFVAARTAEDASKEADINAQIARLTTEKSEIERWQPSTSQIPDLPEFSAPAQQQAAPQVTQQDQAWLERNQWFADEGNSKMKEFVLSAEKDLEDEGFRPGSKACYDALDEKVRQAFPDKFSEKPAAAPVKRSPSPVVGAPRTNGTRSSNGKITLTASEAAICRQLGISYTDYHRNKEAN